MEEERGARHRRRKVVRVEYKQDRQVRKPLAPLFGRGDGEGSRMLVGSCLVLGQALQASSLEAFRDVKSQMRRKAIADGDCRAPDARSCDIVIVHPNLLISTILEELRDILGGQLP